MDDGIADLVSENAIREQELFLRGKGFTSLRALAPLNDKYDSIDLSGNALATVDSIPTLAGPLLRLKTLLLADNRIGIVASDLPKTVPNLHALSLANNNISEWKALQFVAGLPNLKHLVIAGNPIAKDDYRERLRELQPNLKYVDFAVLRRTQPQPQIARGNESRAQALLRQLDAAESLEEVERIEAELVGLAE